MTLKPSRRHAGNALWVIAVVGFVFIGIAKMAGPDVKLALIASFSSLIGAAVGATSAYVVEAQHARNEQIRAKEQVDRDNREQLRQEELSLLTHLENSTQLSLALALALNRQVSDGQPMDPAMEFEYLKESSAVTACRFRVKDELIAKRIEEWAVKGPAHYGTLRAGNQADQNAAAEAFGTAAAYVLIATSARRDKLNDQLIEGSA